MARKQESRGDKRMKRHPFVKMSVFFVVCPRCEKTEAECKYEAKDFQLWDADEIIRIRRGRSTCICPLCESEDCIDPDTNVCLVCDMMVHPNVIVTCKECKHICSALPSVKLAPQPENPDDDPEWCEMDAFCTDMTFMVELSCGHRLCLGCFSSYAANCCKTFKNVVYDEMTKEFVMRCFADCNIPHPLDLLRLGGSSNWEILGEKIIEYRTHLDQNRCICPLPRCGALIDGLPPISEKKVVQCPTCLRMFCRHCNEESKDGECPHHEDLEDDHSFRRCPMCHTPVTHYYGDECHHIGYGSGGCPGCKMQGRVYHWCYYCLNGGKEYPVYCMQNHWFCKPDCPVCPDCPICQKVGSGKRVKHSDKNHVHT